MTGDPPGYDLTRTGDGVHVGSDLGVVDGVLSNLKENVEGIPSPATIRRVRTKLKLSQRRAALLFRVGENAFDKYQRALLGRVLLPFK